jgi:hypothetical protein
VRYFRKTKSVSKGAKFGHCRPFYAAKNALLGHTQADWTCLMIEMLSKLLQRSRGLPRTIGRYGS